MDDHRHESVDAVSRLHDEGDAFLSEADLIVNPRLTLRGQLSVLLISHVGFL
jgi:hypothetical protein